MTRSLTNRAAAWASGAGFEARRERWGPAFWGVVFASAASLPVLPEDVTRDLVDKAVPLLIGVAALLVALQTTAQSLMLVLIDAPVTQRLKKTGHYDRMIQYFRASGRTLLRFIGVGLAIFVLKVARLTPTSMDRTIRASAAFFFVHAFVSHVRLNRIMVSLLVNKGTGPK